MPFPNPPDFIPTPFAENGNRNDIPAMQVNTGSGLASWNEGFPPETDKPIVAGGIPPRRPDFNGILRMMSTLNTYLQAGAAVPIYSLAQAAAGGYPLGAILRMDLQRDGRFVMSGSEGVTSNPNTDPSMVGITDWFSLLSIRDYNPGINHNPGDWVVWRTDGHAYRCLKINGPGYEVGVQNPDIPEYWESMWVYVSRMGGGGGGGGDTSRGYEIAEYACLDVQSPPTGWLVANGQIITNASSVTPHLFNSLQLPVNAWRLVSESGWQTAHNMEPWLGVGGVTQFVLDLGANTIRLPDRRGMFQAASGFAGLLPGDTHGDCIVDITGIAQERIDTCGFFEDLNDGYAMGAFYIHPGKLRYNLITGDGSGSYALGFAASRVVATDVAVTPRVAAGLGCIYVGLPSA